MYRKYFVYIDDGNFVSKVAVPAESEEKAREFCKGNGEIIAIKDVTREFPINHDLVCEALSKEGFGEFEMDFILRTLVSTGIVS